MNWHRTITTLAGLSAVTLLAFAPEQTSQAEAEFVMNFGTPAPKGTPWSDQLEGIKKRVESGTNGKMKIKLFLGSSLGGEVEMMEDLVKGQRIQGGGFSTAAIGKALDLPILELPELPFLFRSTAEADAVLDDVLYTPVSEALAGKGVTFYAWAENGWRSFATNGGPARSPADLAKFKMRSQESAVHLDMYKALGVQAVQKPLSEVVPSLNTGIVAGFDNTPLFSLAAGWIGPVTHYNLSRHIYQPAAVVYNKQFVDALPADVREKLLADPVGEAKKGRSSVRELENALLEQIKGMGKEVVELSDDERASFRKSCRKQVHTQFLGSHPELQGVYGQVKTKLQSMR
jgi:TRAP-type C4-dicarboxylate transport system substrate-binding protein